MYDHYYWILAFGLSWAALSTYWDWLFDEDNYYFHGLCVGLAMLPLVGLGFSWFMVLLRSLILCLLMGIWTGYCRNGWTAELGRGALILFTLWLLVL